jgi:hypothetical protein
VSERVLRGGMGHEQGRPTLRDAGKICGACCDGGSADRGPLEKRLPYIR